MKKICFLVISMFLFNAVMAQTQAIKITNVKTNKEKIIKEGKRIKLKTAEGKKIKGRFMVKNSSTIMLDDVPINLADIAALKRNPLLTSILTSSFLISGGALVAGVGVIIGGLTTYSSGFLLLAPGATMITIGILSPNLNKDHKRAKGWTYEIISIPDENSPQQ